MTEPTEFRADKDRVEVDFPECGIPIRARLPSGAWGGVDIAHLDPESLLSWLRKDGGYNPLAEARLFCLPGRDQAIVYDTQKKADGGPLDRA